MPSSLGLMGCLTRGGLVGFDGGFVLMAPSACWLHSMGLRAAWPRCDRQCEDACRLSGALPLGFLLCPPYPPWWDFFTP